MLAWRIGTDTPHYTADDPLGKGAQLDGGRWNWPGTPIVYASESRALSCLETLVHLAGGTPLPLNRYLVCITIPTSLWRRRTRFNPASHVGWDAEPAGMVSMDWGTSWAKSLRSVIAVVPSVIVPEESNILLNPSHSDAAQLQFTKVRKWGYDSRLA